MSYYGLQSLILYNLGIMPNTTHDDGESQENTADEVADKATDINTDSQEQELDEQEAARQATRDGAAKKLASEILLGEKKLEDLPRITSYNVCYTKLLRPSLPENQFHPLT